MQSTQARFVFESEMPCHSVRSPALLLGVAVGFEGARLEFNFRPHRCSLTPHSSLRWMCTWVLQRHVAVFVLYPELSSRNAHAGK